MADDRREWEANQARGTREDRKFVEDSDGKVAVNTVSEVSGEIKFSGLSEAMLTTTMQVSGTAVMLPPTALTNRNSLSIFNKSETETLYIGQTNAVTADSVVGTKSGWEIGPQENLNIDITNDIVLYGITEGATILVKINEMA